MINYKQSIQSEKEDLNGVAEPSCSHIQELFYTLTEAEARNFGKACMKGLIKSKSLKKRLHNW